MDVKLIALSLMFDGLAVQLPANIKNRDYMVKIFRKMTKKNIYMSRAHPAEFHEAFELAEATGRAVADTGKDYGSISGILEKFIKHTPALISYYKLNPNHLSKLFRGVPTNVIFQTARTANTMLEQLDIEYSYLMNRKEK